MELEIIKDNCSATLNAEKEKEVCESIVKNFDELEDARSQQLADIAISTATNYKAITGEEPRVAMLSFSTNGSADHELVDKVKDATALVRQNAPELLVDGEMQMDAAIMPSIGERKFPGSAVAGKANVLIFPDLNAGNIGYKIAERLGGSFRR